MLHRFYCFALAFIFVAFGASGAESSFQARVIDASGGGVPDASIVVQCGPYRTTVQGGQDGLLNLTLKQSTCTLITTAKGFAPASQVVAVQGQRSEELTIVLQVTGASSAVTVNAQQDAVDVSKIDANPMDLPLAIESVPAQLVATRVLRACWTLCAT